jgi:hypothetical protein
MSPARGLASSARGASCGFANTNRPVMPARASSSSSRSRSRSRSHNSNSAAAAAWPLLRRSPASRQRQRRPAAASSSSAAPQPLEADAAVPLPSTPDQQVALAADAVVAAWRDGGWTRQCVQLELPIIGASDLDDWPGGIRQQFKAALPMVEEMLRRVRAAEPGLRGGLTPDIWDDGDAVGAWTGAPRSGLSCVLFPTAQTLGRLRALADKSDADRPAGGEQARALTVIVNPQWQPDLSDYGGPFGFGRAEALEAASSFRPSFAFTRRRVFGDDVYTFRAFPAPWRVAVVRDTRAGPGAGGAGARLLFEADGGGPAPSYADVERALRARPDSAVNMPLGERLQREWTWNQRSLQDGPPPPQQ